MVFRVYVKETIGELLKVPAFGSECVDMKILQTPSRTSLHNKEKKPETCPWQHFAINRLDRIQ